MVINLHFLENVIESAQQIVGYHFILFDCSVFQVVLSLFVVIWGLRLGLFLLMR